MNEKHTAVAFTGVAKKNVKNLAIPASVRINGKSFPVTAIKDGACTGRKDLESVTIGENVGKIGTEAFKDCQNVKTFNIRTTKLTAKTVGAGAFKTGIKATYKCPKDMVKKYKKLLKSKGAQNGSKFKKN